jgi:adenine-specific DNA methylase
MHDDKRLIEDYLPIEAISAEASREKSVRKGHISTLHLWWARRPLVACRAAVYGALVPASQFVPNGASDDKKKSLGRANAAKFVKRLCQYPSDAKPEQKADIERATREAQRHILEAHAERLTRETGKKVTADDISAGRAPRPRVLDMFAGGGAIPLEASRLGCEAYALDLNPVAHIIELCTLVYPQKYGKPDPSTGGMAGPKNQNGGATWGGLAEEVRHWGNKVLAKVKAEIGDLYPPIPDPAHKGKRPELQNDWIREHHTHDVPQLDSFTCKTHLYGMTKWSDLFAPRQLLCLLSFAAAVRQTEKEITTESRPDERAKAVLTLLAVLVDRLSDFNSSLCTWNYTGGRGVLHTFSRQALPMVWDFAETNPFNPDAASWVSGVEDVPSVFETAQSTLPAQVARGSGIKHLPHRPKTRRRPNRQLRRARPPRT